MACARPTIRFTGGHSLIRLIRVRPPSSGRRARRISPPAWATNLWAFSAPSRDWIGTRTACPTGRMAIQFLPVSASSASPSTARPPGQSSTNAGMHSAVHPAAPLEQTTIPSPHSFLAGRENRLRAALRLGVLAALLLWFVAAGSPVWGQLAAEARTGRFTRGTGADPYFHSILIPLDFQKGIPLDNVDGNATNPFGRDGGGLTTLC